MTEPMTPRLIELAIIGARLDHEWQFDVAWNIDGEDHGHIEPFETCPHADCVLVRSCRWSIKS